MSVLQGFLGVDAILAVHVVYTDQRRLDAAGPCLKRDSELSSLYSLLTPQFLHIVRHA